MSLPISSSLTSSNPLLSGSLAQNSNPEAASADVQIATQDLSASYKNLIEFTGCNLGLILTSNSIEIHVLNPSNDHIIEKIKLSGKKFAKRSLIIGSHQISIEKPDRGELLFKSKTELLAAQYKSAAQSGGVSISTSLRKIDSAGNLLIGATNFISTEFKFFDRSPSDAAEIANWRQALAEKSYKLDGLKDLEIVNEFCSLLKDLYQSWSLLNPMEKIYEIRRISNHCLMQAGVYPCHFPEKQGHNWQKFCPDSLCQFNPLDWSICRSPTFVDKHILTPFEEKTFAADLYRELRLAEHSWLLQRSAAGFQIDISNDPIFADREILKIMPIAAEDGIKATDIQPALRSQLIASYGQQADITASYLKAITGELPALSRFQKILKRFGYDSHFPYKDAQSCVRLVQQLWNNN